VALATLAKRMRAEEQRLREHLVPGVSGLSARLDGQRFALLIAGEDDPEVCEVAREAGRAALHAMVYRTRARAEVVICARPVATTALAMVGITVARCVCDEPLLEWGAAGARVGGVPGEIEPLLGEAAEAVLLGRHGLVIVGDDLRQARQRLERIEHAARVTHAARALGNHAALGEREIAQWQALAAEVGLSGGSADCERCNACSHGQLAAGETEALGSAVDHFLRR
jgi:hypothetical protein